MTNNITKSNTQAFEQSAFDTRESCESFITSIEQAPAKWVELDLTNGGPPIRGREIKFPIEGNEFTIELEGYLYQVVELCVLVNHLHHCYHTRVFKQIGDTSYHISTDASMIEMQRSYSDAISRADKVRQKIGVVRIGDYN